MLPLSFLQHSGKNIHNNVKEDEGQGVPFPQTFTSVEVVTLCDAS